MILGANASTGAELVANAPKTEYVRQRRIDVLNEEERMKLGWVRLCMALFGTAGLVVGGAAAADPLTIRIARGAAAEEQVWLLKAKPELAPNQGKLYNVDMKY